MKIVYIGELSSIYVQHGPNAVGTFTRGVPAEVPDEIAIKIIRSDGARWRSATPEEIEEQQNAEELNAEATKLEAEAAGKEIINPGNAGTVFEEGWGPVDEPDPRVAALAVKPATGGGGTGGEPQIENSIKESPDDADPGEQVRGFADEEKPEE